MIKLDRSDLEKEINELEKELDEIFDGTAEARATEQLEAFFK